MPRRTDSPATADIAALSRFLRTLAAEAERDATFGARLAQIFESSGLRASTQAPPVPLERHSRGARPVSSTSPSDDLPDPFAVLRERGEAELRATLEGLDLAMLRAIIRIHRLDPARLSARWSARPRLVALILDQVRARANHGRAFERV